jgi:DNA helicase-2/ATP-dependent DNA helicase PcrA
MSRDYVLEPFRREIVLQIDYAGELNEQQHAAVTAPPGPALVIAGAGSGKTRTLTYRVAYLLEHGVPPERILLLTFTNKAAREMMRRVNDILGQDLQALWGGTFHSIGNRILRKNASRLGLRPDFTILDREDSRDLIKAAIDDAKIDVTKSRFPKADVVGDILSMAVNISKPILTTLEDFYSAHVEVAEEIERIGKLYAARKLDANVVDFDDLLTLWLKLLREDQDALDQYQRRFEFILVDEYQDTNSLQGEIIDLLAARHKNVMVVGDDSQSIYSWRGANFLNIIDFPKRYPGARVFKIEMNYRSTPEILQVANAAIAENVHQYPKALAAARESGEKPAHVACGDSQQQANFVAQRILELRDEGTSLADMAVLYRSHFHALELQLELRKRGISFVITSGIGFFSQAHIKDVVAFLKLATNPFDELSFKRLIRLLPGIGSKSADKIWKSFLVEYQRTVSLENPLGAAIQRVLCSKSKTPRPAWSQFAITMAQLESPVVKTQPAKMIRLILDAVYEDHLKENYPNYAARKEDIEQLAIFSQQFNSMESFLTQLALQSDVEAEGEREKDAEERLKLSSIHQAKGLEFKIVFVIMLCEGLFPSSRSTDSAEGLEEERRLFYVAVTRAKDELYLTYPIMRFARGEGATMTQPSRFIFEIPKNLLEEWRLQMSYGGGFGGAYSGGYGGGGNSFERKSRDARDTTFATDTDHDSNGDSESSPEGGSDSDPF